MNDTEQKFGTQTTTSSENKKGNWLQEHPGMARIGGALLVAVLLFFTGFAFGRNGLATARTELKQAREEYNSRVQTATNETAQVRTELASSQTVNQVLVARGYLYRAATELERRNFGTAQTELGRAAQLLEQQDVRAAGLNDAAVRQVRESLAGLDLRVSEDISSQRTNILKAADTLGDIVTPTTEQAI